MNKIKVFDKAGSDAGEMQIAAESLVLDRGDQAVHDVVVAGMAARRAGTASTLSKGEVAGSGKKPWRQKGSGRARAGYRQSPVWRGGSAAFGPKPRSYAVKVNRKVCRLAYKRVFSEKLAGDQVRVIEALDLPNAKTSELSQILTKLDLTRSVLIVTAELNMDVMRASRNIPKVEVVRARDVSVYQLLRYRTVLATKDGMDALVERLQDKAEVA